ncbi:MAG: phospholipid carrier-dependent glycosyltransferase [Gemmatimonadetes bacterium]|nr:MAG: phospholipid carrier-dependent glycosyltransferase [Gemmatimonadota bacterium]
MLSLNRLSYYRLNAWLFIAFMALIRLIYINFPPIVPQEAYYWKYAKHLALSYFDHPPAAAWTIALFTAIGGDSPFWIRLGCVIYATGFTVLLYLLTREIALLSTGQPERAEKIAFYTIVTVNVTLLFSIGTTIITPDVPLLFFWMLTLFAVFKLAHTQTGVWWYLAGFGLGAAMISKYSAIFLVIGTLLFLIWEPAQRHWFRRKEPYLAVVLSLLIFSPVLIWNYQHEWASFLFQSADRAKSWFRFKPHYFGQLLGSQTALVTPLIFAGCLYALYQGTRRAFAHAENSGFAYRATQFRFLISFSLPMIALFTLISFQSLVKMNWLAPSYITLIVALALLWAEKFAQKPERASTYRKWTVAAITLAATLTVIAHVLPLYPILPLRKGDTWTGWEQLAQRITELRSQMPPGSFVFSTEYKIPTQITYYTNPHLETYSANIYGGKGLQYTFWNDLERIKGKDALLVTSNASPLRSWQRKQIEPVFERIEQIDQLDIIHHHKLFRRFTIYRCYHYRGLPPQRER